MNTDNTKSRIRFRSHGLLGAGMIGMVFIAGVGAASAAPTTQPANLPPLGNSPAPSQKSTLAPAPYRPWLPPARAPREPRVTKSDGQHALRPRPAVDLPALAEAQSDLPSDVKLEVGPPINVVTVDLAPLPVATLASRADTGAPLFGTDPTLDLASPGALVLSPPPRRIPPPVLLLPIPDPAHQPGAIPATQPVREDGPVENFERPGPTTLPAGK